MEQVYIFEQSSRAANYGVGMYIKQLSACLQHTDREVNVVYLSVNEKTFQVKKESGIRYFYIPAVQESELIDKKKAQDRYYRCAVYFLLPYIHVDENRKLLFHINYNHSPNLVNTLRMFWPTCKVVLSIHYFDWCFTNRGNTADFKRIITDQKPTESKTDKEIKKSFETEKLMFEAVDHIICLSQFALNTLIQDYTINPCKISLVYNGLEDTVSPLNIEEKRQLKKKLYLDAEEKIILFAGRLDDIKGTTYLIQAFKSVLKKNKNCKLILAGDGEFVTNMQFGSEIWNKVIFTGKLPTEQLYNLYQIADMGVMPSMHEQCSYVAIEMMMHSIPIIGSDSTGLDEMVIEGDNGCKLHLVVSKDKVEVDITELSTKIEYLLKLEEKDMNILKIGSRGMYEKRYTRSKMTDAYNKIFKSIMTDNVL